MTALPSRRSLLLSLLYNQRRPRHLRADCEGEVAPLPADQRVPFGWGSAAVKPGSILHLGWKERRAPGGDARLRITVAIDERERKEVGVTLKESGRPLGDFDIRFSPALQPFELPIAARDMRQILSQGVTLRLSTGTTPLWILDRTAPVQLAPHLMFSAGTDQMAEFRRCLSSLGSITPFGWMEGCVLDALHDMGEDAALKRHLSKFLVGDALRYEDPRSRPSDNRIAGIEETLPFAQISRFSAKHPSLRIAIDFWKKNQDSEGCVVDGKTTSAEGSYTVAYPLAVTARVLRDPELEDMAVRQLRVRRKRLAAGEDIYLRSHGDGHRTYRNWARGAAWYMLGLTRTLIELPGREDLGDLRAECLRMAKWAVARQRTDGLWGCFIDDPAVLPDTSGSAGIAAAIALGARHDLLPDTFATPPQRTLQELQTYLTPDGFLTGVSQSNRGGEELQRSDYRVILQFGMGLMGQLEAALQNQRSEHLAVRKASPPA